MTDIMFEIPSNHQISKCIITKNTVINNGKPEIVIDETRVTPDKSININKAKPKSKKETA